MRVARRLGCLVALALLLTLPAEPSPSHRPVSEPTQRPVVVRVRDGGFHWAEASVEAAAMLAATLLAVGLAIPLRPERRSSTSRQAPS